jgi:hypothetical protein
VTTGRTARFLGTTVTVRRHGPNDGDGQVDGTVPGCGGDGDSGGGGRGGGSVVLGVVVKVKEERTVMVEEERDGSVLVRDGEGWADSGNGVDQAAVMAWRQPRWQRCRRGHGKFWPSDASKSKSSD